MEDDPTWFQLVASGSTLEVAQIQADLRRRQSSAESSPLPCQPFVAFEVNESLSQKACKSARSRRDEDAAGHDHVFWFNSEGNLFRNMLKVSVSAVSSPRDSNACGFNEGTIPTSAQGNSIE